MDFTSTNSQQPELVSLVVSNQPTGPTGHISVVLPNSQDLPTEVAITPLEYDPDLTTPRIPGAGRARVLRMAPDFDAPIDL